MIKGHEDAKRETAAEIFELFYGKKIEEVTEEDLRAEGESEITEDIFARALEESRANKPTEVYIDETTSEELDEFYDDLLGDLTIPGPEKSQELLRAVIGGDHNDE